MLSRGDNGDDRDIALCNLVEFCLHSACILLAERWTGEVYFNNCKFGMHGPLEVFSQNAILALQGHFKDCCLAWANTSILGLDLKWASESTCLFSCSWLFLFQKAVQLRLQLDCMKT